MRRNVRSVRLVAMIGFLALGGAALTLRPATAIAQEQGTKDKALINRTLDALHAAASKADGAAYFALYHENAVFLGTDPSERWTLGEFKLYAQKRFDEGKGWTYTPTYRSVYVNADRTFAWFDELLDNEKYGVCRGSGVLVNNGVAWLIIQYNLSVPIPNDLLPGVARMIADDHDAKLKAFEAERAKINAAREAAEKGAAPAGTPPGTPNPTPDPAPAPAPAPPKTP